MTCDDQSLAIAFLSDPASYPFRPKTVECMETHGALVFLAGEQVFKIKRAVKFSYMDFSTAERRRAACQREIEINLPHAPELYLGLKTLTCENGTIAWEGAGEIIEWVVHMRRFAQHDLLSAVALRGPLEADLCRDLADAVRKFHASALPKRHADPAADLEAVAAELDAAYAELPGLREAAAALPPAAAEHIHRLQSLLAKRAAADCVRRCHGDLHLSNIVLWRGRPVLFDALEFDEKLATIDTLYDLAFLLMDLDHCGQRLAANRVLNRYLARPHALIDCEGLALLPAFFALRAGVRAMVRAQRAAQLREGGGQETHSEAETYVEAALSYLAPAAPSLTVVGGLSGTGKTTVAAALAPSLGAAPGAIHLRTDVERKLLFGVEETARLPSSAYTREETRRVYEAVLAKAKAVLEAGHSVIVDGVFARADERHEVERLARACGAKFAGLWLKAPAACLIARVEGRRGDASDATAEVVRQQLAWDVGEIRWETIDASGSAAEVLDTAKRAIEARLGEFDARV